MSVKRAHEVSSQLTHEQVMQANIELHSKMADAYNKNEPHFYPENVKKVDGIVARLVNETKAKKLLDLGCGTGFMIDIAKRHVSEIHGVDITTAMMDRIDRSGDCAIELHVADACTFREGSGSFDMVTGYSFLHHLFDVEPVLQTAYAALKSGGKAYFDLDPNGYFWEGIGALDRNGTYDAIVKREIEMVTYKDEDIEAKFGIKGEVFNSAEYGKAFTGGFKEETLVPMLKRVGFTQVEFFYHWFVGQGLMINDPALPKPQQMERAAIVDGVLQRALPLSRNLYKYVGFIATK